MGTSKITKRDNFNSLLALVKGNDELTAFITHEIELLDKRTSAERKPSKAERMKIEQDEALAQAIMDGMGTTKYTVSALIKAIPDLNGLSTQKVTALLRKMIAEGKIAKSVEKGTSFYAIAQ